MTISGRSQWHEARAIELAVSAYLSSRPLKRRLWAESGRESAKDCLQQEAQKLPQPGEDEAEVVADRREDGVGGIAGTALEVIATQVTIVFHVADDRLDGGATLQLAFDGAEDAAFLA